MATSNLTTLLQQIERQYRPRWHYAAPDTLASRVHDAGAKAEQVVTRLSQALLSRTISFAEWDDATQEALKRLGLATLVISIGGLLFQAALRKSPEDAFAALQADYNAHAAGLAKALATGRITIDDWEAAMSEQVRQYHLGAALAGGGSDRQLATGIAQRNAATQQTFLDQFAADIRSGKLPIDAEARIRQRAQMYAGAGEATFQEASQRSMGMPRLPAYPKDYKTDCRFNCYCHWDIRKLDDAGNWDCYWVYDPEQLNCAQCPKRSIEWNPLKIRGGVVQPYNAVGLFAKGAVPNA